MWRTLICDKSSVYKKTWSLTSKNRIYYLGDRLYTDDFRTCYSLNGLNAMPTVIYKNPDMSHTYKLEANLHCSAELMNCCIVGDSAPLAELGSPTMGELPQAKPSTSASLPGRSTTPAVSPAVKACKPAKQKQKITEEEYMLRKITLLEEEHALKIMLKAQAKYFEAKAKYLNKKLQFLSVLGVKSKCLVKNLSTINC
jgi:hypothetical protein